MRATAGKPDPPDLRDPLDPPAFDHAPWPTRATAGTPDPRALPDLPVPYANGYAPRVTVSFARRRRGATVLVGVTLSSRRSAASRVRSVSPSAMAASAWRADASM